MEAPTGGGVSETAVVVTSKLFQGYQLQVGEGESALSWQLSSGLTWRKKIWPRLACPRSLHRWNTVDEILSYLISFDSHDKWITTKVPVKPPSGSILFYNRTKTKNYRSDGYDWKTRKSNASIREDRMKLKVCGMQLLYGCYTHCASISSLHRRSYWLIQDPDIIMVHYLEVEGDKMSAEAVTPNVDLTLQDEAELQRSLTPASWAHLTISDKNLCSILAQCNTALEIRTLTSQLRLTLDQNLTKATDLDHAIATNNSGLPFDWAKDAQPKRQKTRVAPKECVPVSHEGGGTARLINIGSGNAQTGAVLEQANENQILKALSSSHHVILCCPQNGSVSYVLLNSSSLGNGGLGGKGVGEERGREGEKNEGNQSSTGPVSFENQELPTRSYGEKGCCGPKGKAKAEPKTHQIDYDFSKFNNFASRLTEVDPLQGFVSLEARVPPEDYTTPQITGGRKFESSVKMSARLDSTPGVSMEPVGNPFSLPLKQAAMDRVGERESSLLQTHLPLSPVVPGTSSPLTSLSFPLALSNTAPTPPTTSGTLPTLTSNHSQLAPATTQSLSTHRSLCSDMLDEEIEREGEMFDLSLNLDPESLRDLLKVPLSPVGRGTGAGGERETAMEGCTTLSPISQLMETLVPPMAGREGGREEEEREENLFLEGVNQAGGNGEMVSSANPCLEASQDSGGDGKHYIDIHSVQLGSVEGVNTGLHSAAHSSAHPSLSVFPEPLSSCYQWQDLLHRPTATQSESPHSHAARPHPNLGTSNSSAPSPRSVLDPAHLHQHSPLPLPGSATVAQRYLGEIQQSSGSSSPLVPQSRMAHLEQLYPAMNAPSVPSSLPTPLDEADPSVFPGASILRPPPGGGPSFLSSSSTHSPSLRPPSPPLSLSDNNLSSAMDTCFIPSQPSLSRSLSPRSLSNIPEGVPMDILLDPLNQHLIQQGAGNFMDPPTGLSLAPTSSYRVAKSPTPSSPSVGSVSGHSTVSSLFDPGGESPSVLELCELLSESPNVQQYDFSNTTFTDMEQKQLYKAIQIIQNTFRKFKTQWQQLPRVEDRQKHAALLIENCYTRYRKLKQQQDRAARRIQHNYRMYRNRSREMNRAALFIQQMYRFHRIKRQQPDTASAPSFHHHMTTPIRTTRN